MLGSKQHTSAVWFQELEAGVGFLCWNAHMPMHLVQWLTGCLRFQCASVVAHTCIQWMLSSLIHGDRAKLSCCNEVSVQVSVPLWVCKKHYDALLVRGSAPAFFALTVPLVAFLSLFFFLYFDFIPSCFPSCFHTVLLSRCTPWHPGEQWFSNNLCRKPVDLVIEQCKSENNTKGQFSIFPLVGLRFADTPGLVIGTFIMQAMLRDLAPVELALTWVIWQRIKV